ncbi:MAG: hypothetical protein VW882_03410 [Gammaproteobacteria bacterium]
MDKDLLKFPFQSGPVIANLIFALLFWFFQSIASVAGPFGAAVIPAYVILILLYSHYAIDVVLAAGKGKAYEMVLKFSGFHPQYLFYFLSLIALCVFLHLYLEIWLSTALISLIVPASIAAMGVEKNFFQAMNPLVQLSYMRLYKITILLPIMGIWLFVALLQYMPDIIWNGVQYFIYLSIILWVFYMVGVLVVTQVVEHDEDPLSTPVKAFVEDTAPPEESFTRLTDQWHRLSEVREMTKARDSIAHYIHAQADQSAAAEQVMTELLGWRSTRLAYRFLPDYLMHMVDTGKYGLMYKHYRTLCAEHGAINVTHPEVRSNLYQFAVSMDDDEFIKMLSPEQPQ